MGGHMQDARAVQVLELGFRRVHSCEHVMVVELQQGFQRFGLCGRAGQRREHLDRSISLRHTLGFRNFLAWRDNGCTLPVGRIGHDHWCCLSNSMPRQRATDRGRWSDR